MSTRPEGVYSIVIRSYETEALYEKVQGFLFKF